jgi:hypothetical protein
LLLNPLKHVDIEGKIWLGKRKEQWEMKGRRAKCQQKAENH